MLSIKIIAKSIVDTQKLAKTLAAHCETGDVILLYGDLGSGKTTFAQYFIEYVSSKDLKPSSPTFSLVNVYDTEVNKIYHYDLYRIENVEELHELAFDDALREGVTIVEWPEIIENIRIKDKICLYLNWLDKETNIRTISIKLFGKFEYNNNLVSELNAYAGL